MRRRDLFRGGATVLAALGYGAAARAAAPDAAGLFAGLKDGGVVTIPPGLHHLSKPVDVAATGVTVIGHGAIFDNTINFLGQRVRAYGLVVRNGPGDGFTFKRGQGGHFEGLIAESNTGNGFVLAGSANAQIGWANFISCLAVQNKSNGWLLDATYDRSWVNANAFTACWSRHNGGSGWWAKGRSNYNTWTAHQVEGNCETTKSQPPMILESGQSSLFGGHVVDSQGCGTAIRCGKATMIYGGNYVGAVQGAMRLDAARNVPSPAAARRTGQDDGEP